MVKGFYTDLENAREAEVLVKDVLSALDKSHFYEWVGDQREYFYKGDIVAKD